MRAEVVGGELVASVDAFTVDERFDNELVSKLIVSGPQPGGDKTTVDMRQVAPGRYEAHVPMDKYGSFLLRAEHSRAQEDGSLRPVAMSTGHISNPYPREYASFEADTRTLERAALATGGAFDPTIGRWPFRRTARRLLPRGAVGARRSSMNCESH